MKIGHLENKPAVTPVGTERKGAAGDATGTTATGTEPSAKVELSSAALLGPEGATPEFDAEKVQRIAQAIRDGKFQVNADAIADKLISNAQEVLSRSSH
ncbi:flagellar biosynthesis anti-sigma factor FlgM [Aquabacterium sp. J223]|uniref:flagellar biosynthesis anti-sigma factor FlgM n=1 Tax=Aquabacterium sp. J223 TaxID=2898431 RepID=UPI0021AD87FE|nr:flagellar biosynthesis anti-sigma factor FlgM [Aquabacterium sp. J223]UUX97547.1 flagellar biosynthesis anti-sigma factor FlgM [Aquabacterium sp. J223]